MSSKKILNFYKHALTTKKIDEQTLSEAKKISSETELKKFIQEKLLPISQEMCHDITLDDLLEYEKEASKHLSEEDLKNITGGTAVKNWIVGGLLTTAVTLGFGVATSTASAMTANGKQPPISETTASAIQKKQLEIQLMIQKNQLERLVLQIQKIQLKLRKLLKQKKLT